MPMSSRAADHVQAVARLKIRYSSNTRSWAEVLETAGDHLTLWSTAAALRRACVVAVEVADEDRHDAHGRDQPLGQLAECAPAASLNDGRQCQVLDRVAGQRHLGEQRHVRAGLRALSATSPPSRRPIEVTGKHVFTWARATRSCGMPSILVTACAMCADVVDHTECLR